MRATDDDGIDIPTEAVLHACFALVQPFHGHDQQPADVQQALDKVRRLELAKRPSVETLLTAGGLPPTVRVSASSTARTELLLSWAQLVRTARLVAQLRHFVAQLERSFDIDRLRASIGDPQRVARSLSRLRRLSPEHASSSASHVKRPRSRPTDADSEPPSAAEAAAPTPASAFVLPPVDSSAPLESLLGPNAAAQFLTDNSETGWPAEAPHHDPFVLPGDFVEDVRGSSLIFDLFPNHDNDDDNDDNNDDDDDDDDDFSDSADDEESSASSSEMDEWEL